MMRIEAAWEGIGVTPDAQATNFADFFRTENNPTSHHASNRTNGISQREALLEWIHDRQEKGTMPHWIVIQHANTDPIDTELLHLLSALRDMSAASILIVLTDDHRGKHTLRRRADHNETGTTLRALGFKGLEGDQDGYYFDIGRYKDTPEWLNPRNWANPELWDKYRW